MENAKKKVIFVCTGNTCRSPMAEYMLKHFLKQKGAEKYFLVSSAGIAAVEGQPLSELARKTLKDFGINVSGNRKAKQLRATPAFSDSLIVTMSQGHKEVLAGLKNVISAKELIGTDIYDPYGGDEDDYKQAAALIQKLIDELWQKFLKEEYQSVKTDSSDRQ